MKTWPDHPHGINVEDALLPLQKFVTARALWLSVVELLKARAAWAPEAERSAS